MVTMSDLSILITSDHIKPAGFCNCQHLSTMDLAYGCPVGGISSCKKDAGGNLDCSARETVQTWSNRLVQHRSTEGQANQRFWIRTSIYNQEQNGLKHEFNPIQSTVQTTVQTCSNQSILEQSTSTTTCTNNRSESQHWSCPSVKAQLKHHVVSHVIVSGRPRCWTRDPNIGFGLAA